MSTISARYYRRTTDVEKEEIHTEVLYITCLHRKYVGNYYHITYEQSLTDPTEYIKIRNIPIVDDESLISFPTPEKAFAIFDAWKAAHTCPTCGKYEN